jgi:general stress protein YciG
MPSGKHTLRELATAMGRKGGRARAAKLSPERRSEIARKAAKKRWAKKKK